MAARLALLRAQRQLYTDADVHIHLRNFNVRSNRQCASLVHSMPFLATGFLSTGGSWRCTPIDFLPVEVAVVMYGVAFGLLPANVDSWNVQTSTH